MGNFICFEDYVAAPLAGAAPSWTILIGIGVYLIWAWLLSRIFRKAGLSGWLAWVPFVNVWKTFNLGGRSGLNLLWGVVSPMLLGLGTLLIGCRLINSTALAWILLMATVVSALIYICIGISVLYNIQKKLDKPGIFLVLYFINLIAPLWLWILALDNSKWRDSKGRATIK
ncbi:MAG: hypothetical protein LBL08_03545 [Candidatus Nomurabacteria bacterium]|jgi:uncharacterized membrane protein (DUF485 family)|nr:hypothetical protein [Candidatus Nomurabacteria bacterium]